MSADRDRQATGRVKRYRFFLCLLLLAVLTLAGAFCYSVFQKTRIPKEGTLVRRVSYERRT